MQRTIFVNLPVADLDASKAFYTALGYSLNEMFSSDDCACVEIEENIAIMLLGKQRFAHFVTGEIADPRQGTGHLICLSAESRDEVLDITAKAVTAGAGPWQPAHDGGYIYSTSFTDPDGHVLEIMWMDVAAAAEQMAGAVA